VRLAAAIVCLLSTTVWAEPAAWHVRGDDTDLWLLGSVHYLRDQDYPLPTIIDDLYQRADSLVMELDLDDLDLLAVQGSFMQAGVLPESSPLETIVDADVYDLTALRASELGLPISLLGRLEPWLVALTLMDMGMSKLGYQANQGLALYPLRRAQADSKPIIGLESLDDQIGIFDSLSWEDQEALLVQTLTDLQAPEENMTRLLDAWRDGSLDELASELSTDFEDLPGLETALVSARNRRWIVKLEQLLNEGGRYLVVVGALHLVGEDSVIDLLAERGFEVTFVEAR
jgi:uncharacterized protein YbaP (TraB family)